MTTTERDIGQISGKLDPLINQVQLLDKKLDTSMHSMVQVKVHDQRISEIEEWRGRLWHRMIGACMLLFAVMTFVLQFIKEIF
jgi:uncharacterized protein HemX